MNFKGTTNLPSSVQVERNFTETNGWESVYTYKGQYADILAASTNSAYVGNASRVNVRQEGGGYGVLQVTFSSIDNTIVNTPTTEPETDTWTFAPYEVQRNTFEHPYFSGLRFVADPGHVSKIIAAVDSYQNKVKAAMEAGTKVSEVFKIENYMYGSGGGGDTSAGPGGTAETDTTGVPLVYSSTVRDKTTELAHFLAYGRETYNEDKYTLRNTRVVPANTLLKASTYRKGYQWTTNRLVDLILAQKTDVTKYSICGELLLDFAGTYWLKKAPTIMELYNGKFEIATEFINMEAGELPAELYPYHT
jgi:hypothetical protein